LDIVLNTSAIRSFI